MLDQVDVSAQPVPRVSARRAEATRRRRLLVTERIQRAALELMAVRGYHAVTVEDVAVAASVSSRTFFRHFACKDDVVLHLERRALQRICDGLTRRPGGEPAVEALRSTVLAVTKVRDEERALVMLHARVLASVPSLQAQAMGEQCSGTGPLVAALAGRMGLDPATDARPALLASVVAAATSVSFARWAASGGLGEPTVAVSAAIDAVLAGVGALVGW